MGTAIATNPKQVAQKIIEALSGGLQKAAECYNEYIKAGGDPMSLRPYIPMSNDLWRTLEDVACGRIDTRIFCLPTRISHSIKVFPKSEQTKIIDSGIELLSIDGSPIRVRIEHLTPEQSLQVFNKGSVRSLAEQAAWLKRSLRSKSQNKFEIKGKKLFVYYPVEFSANQLKEFLREME